MLKQNYPYLFDGDALLRFGVRDNQYGYIKKGMLDYAKSVLAQYPDNATWDDLSQKHQIDILNCCDWYLICQNPNIKDDFIDKFYLGCKGC